MRTVYRIAILLMVAALASGQSSPPVGGEISGMYSFVHEGEFVQLEANGDKVDGVVSRFKSDDPEKAEAQFVDQSFESGKLQGSELSFRTRPLDGVWFEFTGKVERGEGKSPSDESYWIIRGKLTETRKAADGKTTTKTHELTMKSFPLDASPSR
jgi:hypothetical protein